MIQSLKLFKKRNTNNLYYKNFYDCPRWTFLTRHANSEVWGFHRHTFFQVYQSPVLAPG